MFKLFVLTDALMVVQRIMVILHILLLLQHVKWNLYRYQLAPILLQDMRLSLFHQEIMLLTKQIVQ